MQPFSVPPLLPLHLPERPKPTPEVPKLSASSGAKAGGDARSQDTQLGGHLSSPEHSANLFQARLQTQAERADAPPLDTREVGDQDIIDPMRPTARIPDPLLSLEEAKAGKEAPLPMPPPIVSTEDARDTPREPDPVETQAAAKAQAQAVEAEKTVRERPPEGGEAPVAAPQTKAQPAEQKAAPKSEARPEAAAAPAPAPAQATPAAPSQPAPEAKAPQKPG